MKLTKTQIIKEFPSLKNVVKDIKREIKDYNDLFGLIYYKVSQSRLVEMIQKKKLD